MYYTVHGALELQSVKRERKRKRNWPEYQWGENANYTYFMVVSKQPPHGTNHLEVENYKKFEGVVNFKYFRVDISAVQKLIAMK